MLRHLQATQFGDMFPTGARVLADIFSSPLGRKTFEQALEQFAVRSPKVRSPNRARIPASPGNTRRWYSSATTSEPPTG